MIEYYMNIAYTENYMALTNETEGEKDLSVQTKAIAFLMLAAGIDRIMDKPACYEFLSRIAILLKPQNVIDSFFKDDILFVIHASGYKYKVTMKDIEMHLGMEISNAPDDVIPRKSWLKHIKGHWKAACIMAVIDENPMLEKVPIDKNVCRIATRSDKEISKEYLNIVDLFAREALKTIPEECFDKLAFRVAEVRQNLADYRKELKKKPRYKFSYAKIPQHTKAKILGACFGYIKNKDARESMYIEAMFVSLVYLAWLWANGYVRVYQVEMDGKKAYTADVDPRMNFSYEDYDGLNNLEFGINIYSTFYDFGLDKVYMLLKESK